MRRRANGMVSGLPQRWVAARVLPRARAMRLLQKRRVSMARRRGVRPASPAHCLPLLLRAARRGGPGCASDHSGRRPDGSVASGRFRTRNSSVSLPLAAAFSAAAFWGP